MMRPRKPPSQASSRETRLFLKNSKKSKGWFKKLSLLGALGLSQSESKAGFASNGAAQPSWLNAPDHPTPASAESLPLPFVLELRSSAPLAPA